MRRRKDLVLKCVLYLCVISFCLQFFHILRHFVVSSDGSSSERGKPSADDISITTFIGKPMPEKTVPFPLLTSRTTCPGLTALPPKTKHGFQSIKGSDSFLYAAHLEKKHVIVIALVKNKFLSNRKLYCQLWYNGSIKYEDPLQVVDAEEEIIPESHSRKYTAAFIKCLLDTESAYRSEDIVAVSVVIDDKCRPSDPTAPPLTVLAPPLPGNRLTSEYTVCVTPFNFRYSRVYELIEMVEFNKILGADKIVFYNFSTGPNVDQVLQMYIRSGDVDVLPWPLPMHVDSWPSSNRPSEVWYFGQLAALNDCLVRHRYRARYIVFTDLDEFIVPLQDSNWTQLVSRLRSPPSDSTNSLEKKDYDIFIFRCVFFRKEWHQPAPGFETLASKIQSAVLGYTRREKKVLPTGVRSKLILNPRSVQEVGVHQVWQSSAEQLSVPSDIGLVYHYRSWEQPDQQISFITSNDVALRFGHRLAIKVQEVRDRLHGVPMDIDIKSYGNFVN
ncbi:upf0392 protein f13g3.3 [Plakobranchus ocellatus]|uniref:Glycosyltransferase family 92 protein n=1 Tax=Plakobranchus ocellatus TaxID=259542 RepID=A0AAV4A7U9_9GAST|nr:upf0392 protein f13g3.3 [Plakobranchus ocellatus]